MNKSRFHICPGYMYTWLGNKFYIALKLLGFSRRRSLITRRQALFPGLSRTILWRLFHSANPPATGWYTFSISGDTPPFIPSVDFISHNKFLKVSAWKGSEWERESWFINLKSRPHVWSHIFLASKSIIEYMFSLVFLLLWYLQIMTVST